MAEALDEFDPDNRIAPFAGATSLERREELKTAFNAEDHEPSLRILICTDAAREGINLQKRCHDLAHFDLPWRPSRLEQRNGRIDRELQPSPEVCCRYFRYEQRPTDVVLAALVRKTERIREELGAVGKVIEDRIARHLGSGGLTSEQVPALLAALEDEQDDALIRHAAEEVDDETHVRRERLREEIDRLRRALEVSRRRVGVDPDDLAQVADVALRRINPELSRENLEELGGTKVFDLDPQHPAFRADPTWARIFDDLRERPRKRSERVNAWRNATPPRRLSFELTILEDGTDAPHVAQLHLENRLIKRLLARFMSQGFQSDLNRACAITGRGAQPRVVLLGRLALFGDGASRLHEESIPVTAFWTEADRTTTPLRPLAEGRKAEHVSLEELDTALRTA